MKENLDEKITQKLKEEISYSGLTKTEIAKAIGVSKPTLSQYLSGKIHPSISTLSRLCSYLGCSADDILCVGDEERK